MEKITDSKWKSCSVCNTYKTWDAYHKNSFAHDWHKSACIECLKNKKKYNKWYSNDRSLNTWLWDRLQVQEWIVYQWQNPASFIRFWQPYK